MLAESYPHAIATNIGIPRPELEEKQSRQGSAPALPAHPVGKPLKALRSAEGFLEHLKPTFIDKLAQRYDPAEAFEE